MVSIEVELDRYDTFNTATPVKEKIVKIMRTATNMPIIYSNAVPKIKQWIKLKKTIR